MVFWSCKTQTPLRFFDFKMLVLGPMVLLKRDTLKNVLSLPVATLTCLKTVENRATTQRFCWNLWWSLGPLRHKGAFKFLVLAQMLCTAVHPMTDLLPYTPIGLCL